MKEKVCGVVIDSGVSDWQIFQRNDKGTSDIEISGRWGTDNEVDCVEARIVREESGVPLTSALDWTMMKTNTDGTWSGILSNVPAGGLYRLETHLVEKAQKAREWSKRGDMRHFIGVGDLWIIAGQSNSAGYGRGPSYDPPEMGIHVYNNAMKWAIATQPLNESTDTAHPVNREGANSGHSPWLHWARIVKTETGIPIGLIQTSLGGSPLVSWNPTEPGEHLLYDTMLNVVESAGGAAKGVLWYQGCSDTAPNASVTYGQRFMDAVKSWRRALKNQKLFVLTVQISRVYGIKPDEEQKGWSVVREAQRRVPHKIDGVAVVPTLDLPLSDGIHISPAGNMLLADRAAQAVLSEVYGKDVSYLAPEPSKAKRSKNGTEIELSFANVTSRIDTINPAVIPFAVEDEKGKVPVSKLTYQFNDSVILELGRSLVGDAVIHGAYGTDPVTVPHDMVRFIPMLGFYGFNVD
ncbi:MAG: sialate O-acetylesterase [Victivallales bacterium]